MQMHGKLNTNEYLEQTALVIFLKQVCNLLSLLWIDDLFRAHQVFSRGPLALPSLGYLSLPFIPFHLQELDQSCHMSARLLSSIKLPTLA